LAEATTPRGGAFREVPGGKERGGKGLFLPPPAPRERGKKRVHPCGKFIRVKERREERKRG